MPEPSDGKVDLPETPGVDADPSQVFHRVAEVGEFPVQNRPDAFGADDEIAVPEVPVNELGATSRDVICEPAEGELEDRLRLVIGVVQRAILVELVPGRREGELQVAVVTPWMPPGSPRTGGRAWAAPRRTRRRAGSSGRSSRRQSAPSRSPSRARLSGCSTQRMPGTGTPDRPARSISFASVSRVNPLAPAARLRAPPGVLRRIRGREVPAISASNDQVSWLAPRRGAEAPSPPSRRRCAFVSSSVSASTRTSPIRHHSPTFGIEAQGSRAGSALPAWSSSMEMPSGERTKAMCPSRGGRLMVTPASISF